MSESLVVVLDVPRSGVVRVAGPLEDLYALRRIVGMNGPKDATSGEVTTFLREVLDWAGKFTRDSHVFLARFHNGDRVAFVKSAPAGVTLQAAGETALRADKERT